MATTMDAADFERYATKYYNRFFKTVAGAKLEIVQLRYDDEGQPVHFTRRSKQDTFDILSNVCGTHKLWWHSPDREVYEGITVDPKCTNPRSLNLFTTELPFKRWPTSSLEGEEEAKVAPLLAFQKEVLCSGACMPAAAWPPTSISMSMSAVHGAPYSGFHFQS